MHNCATRFDSCTAEILEHELLARDTKRLRLSVPKILANALPGQFFMLRDHRSTDPLIGRALALYAADPLASWIDVVYLVHGKFTKSIAGLRPGDELSIWGPLGNSFDSSPTEHLIMVAGGIGYTPFLALAQEAIGKQQFGDRRSGYSNRVTLCYGVRSKSYLVDLGAFERAGARVQIATEDGSIGPPQRVTDLLVRLLESEQPNLTSGGTPQRLVCCGPEAMMEAVARIACERSLTCEVSLETPMACGIGICFSCVTRIGTADNWDYRRTCVEGPVFDAQRIVW